LRGKREVSLFTTRKNVSIRHWDKQFYEEPDNDIIRVLQGPNKRVLSIGAGYGGLEEEIKRFGHYVIAIPIDNLMAASLQHRGIEVTDPNFGLAFKQLEKSSFDCVILSNVLQHLDHPENLIDSVQQLIKKEAKIIVKIHNYSFFRWKSFRSLNFVDSNLNCIDIKEINRWFKKRMFNVAIKPQGSEKVECLFRLVGPITSSYLARSFVIVASK
jgi:2-polyprenyl-3-methyl-5-hydroxy-6-metoxy-1,4-benzoquinol methylase